MPVLGRLPAVDQDALQPARDGRLVSPDEAGGTNYRSPSFDPSTGLLVVSAHDAYGLYFFKPEHGEYGWAGASPAVYGHGVLRAIDYQTGRIRWNHDLHGGAGAAGVLTTASGLTFTGDSAGSALALRTSDGTTLWHSGVGRVGEWRRTSPERRRITVMRSGIARPIACRGPLSTVQMFSPNGFSVSSGG